MSHSQETRRWPRPSLRAIRHQTAVQQTKNRNLLRDLHLLMRQLVQPSPYFHAELTALERTHPWLLTPAEQFPIPGVLPYSSSVRSAASGP